MARSKPWRLQTRSPTFAFVIFTFDFHPPRWPQPPPRRLGDQGAGRSVRASSMFCICKQFT